MVNTLLDLKTIDDMLGTTPAIPIINEMDRFARSRGNNVYANKAGDNYVKRMIEENVGEQLVQPYWLVYQEMIKGYGSNKLTYLEVNREQA